MKRKLTAALTGVLVVYELTSCTAAGPPPPMAGPNPAFDRIFFYLQYLFPLFIFIVFCSLAGFGIYLAVNRGAFPRWKYGKSSPFGIAGERYARGELSRDEYIRIIEDLKSIIADENGIGELDDL